MDKFGRNYQLKVGIDDKGHSVTIKPPFTIEFDITRNTLTSANVAQIRIYNLSLLNRNQMRFNISDYGQFRPVELKAGYQDNLVTIFSGNISQAWSVREGTNFITQIESYDGGFAFNNSKTNAQFPAGTSERDVMGDIAGTLPGVSKGAIGDYPNKLTRSNSHSGNSTDILSDLSGGGFFIDNGKVNILGTSEYIDTPGVLEINSRTGLLGTPILEQTIVRFDMIFEPALQVGTKIKLDSITEANFKGEYKVTSVKHRGMISEAVCGSVITTGEFFYSKILRGVGNG